MENTVVRNELIRKELEKKYTHVTFVKTRFSGKEFEWTEWTVNDEMKGIRVPSTAKIEDVLINLELNELSRYADCTGEKFQTFRTLMRLGRIPTDHKLYKKYTLKQLKKML